MKAEKDPTKVPPPQPPPDFPPNGDLTEGTELDLP